MAKNVPLYGDLLQCPYEQSHLIRPERMQVHLMKCEKQHPKIKLEKCRFNYSHHIKPEELQEHHRTCPDRILVDSYMYTTEGESSRKPPTPPPAHNYTPEQLAALWGEENWDDMDEKPYDPQVYCNENRIIQKARMMTKSEKRAFYKKESERHEALWKKEQMAAELQAKAETSKPKNQPKNQPKNSPKKKN